MICFLTSNPLFLSKERLNPANRFVDELHRIFPDPVHALFVCSDPNSHERTDHFAGVNRRAFENSGFEFLSYRVLDGRNAGEAASLVSASDLIILAGGHVPTQNAFFSQIGLRELLIGHTGVIVGISAGSMNSADVVYVHPEAKGEAVDPAFRRFAKGLNLTKRMILPHYSDIKDDVLDGLRVFEDIAYPDSVGREFYAISDGSYLYVEDGQEELRGESYLIKDGVLSPLSADGDVLPLGNA